MHVRDVIPAVRELTGRTDDSVLIGYIRNAVQRLMDAGNFRQLQIQADICSTGDCRTYTLPNEIETPLGIAVGGHPKIFRGHFAEFHINGGEIGGYQSFDSVDDVGFFPTQMDIVQAGRLFALSDSKSDEGVILVVKGFDEYGSPLNYQNEDGKWLAGWPIKVSFPSAYGLGFPSEPTERTFRRNVSLPAIDLFEGLDHQLVTGQPVTVDSVSGLSMPPVLASKLFYARRVDSGSIYLYRNRSDSIVDRNRIGLEQADATSSAVLVDSRGISVLTNWRTNAVNPFVDGDIVRVSGGALPDPYENDRDYFVRAIDDQNFTLHETAGNATENVDPVDAKAVGSTLSTSLKRKITPRAIFETTAASRFRTGDAVRINSDGTLPTPLQEGLDYYVGVISSTEFSLHSSQADAASGSNEILVTGQGSGSFSAVKTIPCSIDGSAVVTAIEHGLEAGVSDLVSFFTDGTYPTFSPAPSPTPSQNFKVGSGSFSNNTFETEQIGGASISVTDLGSGQLFLVISRAFSLSFEPSSNIGGRWDSDVEFLSTGDEVSLSNEGAMPTTSPQVSSGTSYYIRTLSGDDIQLFESEANANDLTTKTTVSRERTSNVVTLELDDGSAINIGDWVFISGVGGTGYNGRFQVNAKPTVDEIEYTDVAGNETNTADAGGSVSFSPILPLGFGTQDTFLSVEFASAIVLFDDELIRIESSYHLGDDLSIKFTTDGTLPSPLSVGATYTIERDVSDQRFARIRTSGGSVVNITGIGSGDHEMKLEIEVSPDHDTGFDVPLSEYITGDEVVLEVVGDADSPLVNEETYFVNRVSNSEVALYDTEANAIAGGATGKIIPTTRGAATYKLRSEILEKFVKRVTGIDKPVTNQSINLYCWDDGRTASFTVIGRYEPNDTERMWRRIRIGVNKAEWIRIIGKMAVPNVQSSNDWLPFRDETCVANMAKAIFLERQGHIEEAAVWEAKATSQLRQAHNAVTGPVTIALRVDPDLGPMGDDPNIF